MKLNYSSILNNLEQISERMKNDELSFGLIGCIGNTPNQIGEFFAQQFNCELVHLSSMQRKNKNKPLAKIANGIYPLLPENILRFLSRYYLKMYSSSERVIQKENGLERFFQENNSSVLLVDDNTLTGKTLEIWKQQIQKKTNRKVYTFTIAVSGDYHPDYYCFDSWHSFEWRPIGI